jgi:hypothetical protein
MCGSIIPGVDRDGHAPDRERATLASVDRRSASGAGTRHSASISYALQNVSAVANCDAVAAAIAG